MFRQILIVALTLGVALSTPAIIEPSLSVKLRAAPVLDRVNNLKFSDRAAKTTFLREQLEALRLASQHDVLALLSISNVKYNSFWINNKAYVRSASAELISQIAKIPDVVNIREEDVATIPTPILENSGPGIQAEWGINKIEAEAAWGLPGGNNGQGVVVAIHDTGVRHTHNALRNNYREAYGWFDPYDGGATPIDLNGHGTHVTGTVLGSGGIGVAPGAQYIACRGCSTSSCSEFALTSCGQWIACPTLPDGSAPNCTMAPRISQNSWGGLQPGRYEEVIQAWHAANVVPVIAVHNYGPSCSSTMYPGDDANVIGVGSTTEADVISSFSGRGPNGDILKPDISAPGSDVRSSYNTNDDSYATLSGTSMATPHVSGLVALLLSRNNALSYEQVKGLLENHADRELGQAATCGGTPYDEFPNNIYGYGRINARRSLSAAINGTSF